VKTDCPNCSWLLEGDFSPGMNIVCPFCGETFEVCAAPFEQLRKFMETHWPAVEFGPFRDYGYPRKNYTGWIIHRLRENDPAAVIDLMTEFHQDREYAAEKVNTLWTFDFSPYLQAEPETLEEIRALWLRVRFTSHARPESQNIAILLREALWTEKIELTPYWIGKALELFEEKRLELDPDGTEEIEPITESDLAVSLPQGNPLFDWAAAAPLAIRERLLSALRMCGYSFYGDTRPPNSHHFKLDSAQEHRWGADCGYASKCLMDSNIFCAPLPESYAKLFSKEEFAALLAERGGPSKPSYSRKRMLELLYDTPDGAAWVEQKVKERRYVRLHPTLSDYCDEIDESIRRGYRLYEAIGMIPVPGKED